MGNLTILENIIDKKLNSVHTAFLAKVIRVNDGTADITILQKNTIIKPNVPVIHSARKKSDGTLLQSGDIVICVCCENNISTAKKGEIPSSSEPIDRFSISNAIVVGIL